MYSYYPSFVLTQLGTLQLVSFATSGTMHNKSVAAFVTYNNAAAIGIATTTTQ